MYQSIVKRLVDLFKSNDLIHKRYYLE